MVARQHISQAAGDVGIAVEVIEHSSHLSAKKTLGMAGGEFFGLNVRSRLRGKRFPKLRDPTSHLFRIILGFPHCQVLSANHFRFAYSA
jgi:hypothetical protein